MIRFVFAVVFALGLGLAALSDDKKADDKKAETKTLKGTWVREAEGIKITFAFKKDTYTATVAAGDNSVKVTCKYTIDKDGVVKSTVTDVEEKGEFPSKPPKGLEMSFKFTVDGKKAKLDDLKGEGTDAAKPAVEGEYEAMKD
jgi:hypothetical protein